MERSDEVYLAYVAGVAGRYDDMVDSMKKVCMLDGNLSLDERNLLFQAYKRKVDPCRNSWRSIYHVERNCHTEYPHLINEYRQKMELELDNICNDACHLIDLYLLPLATDPETVVFYNKMYFLFSFFWALTESIYLLLSSLLHQNIFCLLAYWIYLRSYWV